MQKSNLLLLVFTFLCGGLLGQTATSDISWKSSFKEGESALSHLAKMEHANPGFTWEVKKVRTDKLGMTHYRTQQQFHGIPVEGADYLLHEENGNLISANGLLVYGPFESKNPIVSQEEAWQLVTSEYPKESLWAFDEGKEEWIKEFKNDPNASFYSPAELVYVDQKFSKSAETYRLAWKVDVWVDQEIDHQYLYFDAHTGELIWKRHMTTSGCATHKSCSSSCTHNHVAKSASVDPRPGSGYTHYNGIQEFTADSSNSGVYRLFDQTRGGGIWTRNALRTTDTQFAQDFEDDDNFWDMRNQFLDDAALDCHWGTEQTYDFWKNEYDWDSYDGNGSRMLSYVHWDFNWRNASWNGMFARFGDGNQEPLTYIDITAHEFAHGLTGTTAGLVYQDQPGALNESFSDIFGSAVEFYALGDSAFWTLGVPASPFRDMSNPNRYGDPDTYLGDNWFTGAGDNGGVHVNSGVQNFWYYLLCQGGTGINDNGLPFTVDSIGMQKASAIAFRNLTVYLTTSSQYVDARYGALAAAKDLYGACSPEVEAVAQAWAAVGIGSPEVTTDVELVATKAPGGSCGLEGVQEMSASFRLNPTGCDLQLDSGTTVVLGYQVNDETPVEEILELDEDLIEGDVLEYTFTTMPDFSAKGLYEIDFWLTQNDDVFAANDTIRGSEVRNPVTLSTSPSSVIFRTFSLSVDSFYKSVGPNAVAEIDLRAANRARKGILGFLMSGQGASPGNIDFPTSEEDNFTKNPNFGAKICFCVDASDWREARVAFDIKQTYSAAYTQLVGQDVPEFVSSMRMTLNGEQVGDQYHPTEYTSDPWNRDTIEINQGAGIAFEYCFEGKHFIDRELDETLMAGTGGDNTYLDEIVFYDPFTVSNEEVERLGIEIQPNPGSDYLNIAWDASIASKDMELVIYTTDGKVQDQRLLTTSQTNLELNTSDWNAGSYLIQLKGAGWTRNYKWMKL